MNLKAPFQDHLDIYEGGRQTEYLVLREGDFEPLEEINHAGVDLYEAV